MARGVGGIAMLRAPTVKIKFRERRESGDAVACRLKGEGCDPDIVEWWAYKMEPWKRRRISENIPTVKECYDFLSTYISTPFTIWVGYTPMDLKICWNLKLNWFRVAFEGGGAPFTSYPIQEMICDYDCVELYWERGFYTTNFGEGHHSFDNDTMLPKSQRFRDF